MKKWLFLFASLFLVSLYACSDDSNEEEEEMMEEEDECEGTTFTYTNDVKSIVDSNCTLSGCHDGSTGLPDFRTFDGIKASATNAASRVNSMNMPPASSGKTLTAAQISTIVCWAANGAPE
jgi:hypothetical protein